MADIFDLQHFRDTGEIKSLEEVEEENNESLASLDEMAAVMIMSSDELFVELLARIEYGKSLRTDVATPALITELTNRALHMELLCEMATNLSE